jgi:FKBP-type peptidyl-prolyl cis-trans isomerase FklB
MKIFKSAFVLILSFTFLNVYAAKVETDLEKISYTLGVVFGENVNRQGMELDTPAFLQAIEDVLSSSELKISKDDMQVIMQEFQKAEQERQNNQAGNNKTNGEKYLADNKTKEGVTETASGLQYKVITAGTGKKPSSSNKVLVHYRGTLIDGTEFDSSYARGEPVELGVGQVIKGWQETLPLMAVGSKWQIVVPSELGYGARGAGGAIGPNATLLFDIELIEIK